MSMPGAPASRAEPNRRRKRSFRLLLSIPVVAVAAAGVLAVNVPTVGAAVASWYHHYEITRRPMRPSTGSGTSWTSRRSSG